MMQKQYTRSWLSLVLMIFLFLPSFGRAQLTINEGSNRNYLTIADEDGDYRDWIEIYNGGTDTINLLNYALTDDPAQPNKWTFPSVKVAPNGFKLVFCSGKNRKPSSGFVTVLTENNYVATNGWNTHTFDTPFYWDGVSNVLINTCSYSSTGYTENSVFEQTQTPFNSSMFAVLDGSDASCYADFGSTSNLRPNIRLNGVQVGNGSIQNSNTSYPAPYGNWYWVARHQLLFRASELSAAGLSAGWISSLSFNVLGTNGATSYDYITFAMKLVNENNLSGIFQPIDPNMYLHTNFAIGHSGETIHLFNPSGIELSNLYVQCDQLNVSKGHQPNGSATLTLFNVPTPDASNNTSATFSSYLLEPIFSVGSGVFTTSFEVSIDNPNGANSQVRYTLDGSDPTTSSAIYDGTPIPIFTTVVLRAKVFANGVLPSKVATASYLLGISHVTPVISVATDYSNLYGSTGIFENWFEDWQRNAHMDYFSADGELLFSRNSAMQVDGGWGGSRYHPQHSFRLEMDNSVLGDGGVQYPVIPNREERTNYGSFYLRNGSNQYLQLPYKDACQNEILSSTTNNYYSAWRPVTVYINGNYFGLYELREKLNSEFFEEVDGADQDSIDILSLSAWNNFALRAVEGNPVDTFWMHYDQFASLDPQQPNYWSQADQYFDLTYYTDYIIAESWVGNVDWPQNNIKIVRSNATGHRYRFCTIDMELALAPNSWTDCYSDHIAYLLSQSPDNPFINVWLKSMQNDQFYNFFINRFADVMNTEYLPERTLAIEQDFFDQTVVEMQNEFARWGDPNQIPQQMNTFYQNHLTFSNQLALRNEQVRNHIESNFGLPNQVDLTLDVHPLGAGKIHISTITPGEYPWSGIYFNGLPIKIEAIANPGYAFSNWGTNALISDVLDPVFLDTLDITQIQFDAYFEENGLGLSSQDLTYGFHVYPNPAIGQVTLVNGNASFEELSYEIIDMTGRRLQAGTINTIGKETIITTKGLPASVYLVRILSDQEVKGQLRLMKMGN